MSAAAADPPVALRWFRRHGGLVRVTHWINVVCFTLLLMSGLQIFNAHPALYIGQQSDFESLEHQGEAIAQPPPVAVLEHPVVQIGQRVERPLAIDIQQAANFGLVKEALFQPGIILNYAKTSANSRAHAVFIAGIRAGRFKLDYSHRVQEQRVGSARSSRV